MNRAIVRGATDSVALSDFLSKELKWLERCILERVEQAEESPGAVPQLPPAPEFTGEEGPYALFIRDNELNAEERLLLALALCPQLQPDLIIPLCLKDNRAHLWPVPEAQCFLPSVETACYLLAGQDMERRLRVRKLFGPDHLFYMQSVLEIGESPAFCPPERAAMGISKAWLDLFTTRAFQRPRFSPDFPAHRLETALEWEDVILNELTLERIEEIRGWHMHLSRMREEMGLAKHIRRGYRALFHGPSGTGKTLVAALLGKTFGKDVYRIDLSTVVSKYIGETAKSLDRLFRTAEDKDWILFFDEGDALFSKRLDTAEAENKNAHYANQDTAFLLQRIEDFNGLIIVASNFRKNIDDAFTRRFQTIVKFNIPKVEQALRLWEDNAPKGMPYETGIDFGQIQKQHSLAAATILKVIQRATVLSLMQGEKVIRRSILERCIMDEKM